MKQLLQRIISSHKFNVVTKVKTNSVLLNWVLSQTQKYPNISLAERIYIIINNDNEKVCPFNKDRTFKSLTNGYILCGKASTCQCTKEIISKKVSKTKRNYSDDEKEKINNKRRKTNLKKYKTENISQLQSVKNKKEKTNIKKTGFKTNLQCPNTKEQIKQTNLKQLGVEYPQQSKLIRQKTAETNIERYGAETPLLSESIKEQIELSNLSKYGSKNPLSSKEIQDKIKKTNINRYGVENPLSSNEVQKKVKQTNLEKYGSPSPLGSPFIQEKIKQTYVKGYPSQRHISSEHLDILQNKNEFIRFITGKQTSEILRILNISITTYNKKLIEFNIRDKKISRPEEDIKIFLAQYNIKLDTNTRKIIPPLELDIYIPNNNLAIEYCGLYWHSEKYKNKNYHQEKWKMCQEKDIRLITIFEDEWMYKQQVCQNRILQALNLNNTVVGGRSLLIKQITSNESRTFLNNNHIQGPTPSKFHYGAYNKDELVAVMSFSNPRRALSQTSGYELIRFCTNGNNYPGVASRLFKAFTKEHNPSKITSFCDLRWGTGNLYGILGFNKEKITSPNYWYFNNNLMRYHRYRFTKHTIIKEFDGDTNLTEYQNMKNLGYERIWDCGNIKFTYNTDTNTNSI